MDGIVIENCREIIENDQNEADQQNPATKSQFEFEIKLKVVFQTEKK
jgi:uncharacterized protein with NRDE domain